MNHAENPFILSLDPVVSRARELLLGATRPLVIALDGRSGAGKSFAAGLLAEQLGAVCVPCDDFFAAGIPTVEWDARRPVQRAADALDWRRLRIEALEPLLAGRSASWFAFDFTAGPRADGCYASRAIPAEQPPRPVIILDGAYSSRQELADVLDMAILVEASTSLRHTRLAKRGDPVFLAEWHARWDVAEEHYFTIVRPPSTFDFVLRFHGAALGNDGSVGSPGAARG
jgi:uridine kinase